MPSPHYFRIRIRNYCPRPVLRIHNALRLLLIFLLSPFVFAFIFFFCYSYSSHVDDPIPFFVGTRYPRLIDDLLDEALLISLSISQNQNDGRHRVDLRLGGANAHPSRVTTYQPPLVSSALDFDALRAQACQILRGKSIFLVGPHETLYQLHSYLLTVLHPDSIPGSTTAPTTRPLLCPGGSVSSSCPSHPLCHPTIKPPSHSTLHSGIGTGTGTGSGSYTTYDYGYESPSLALIRSTNSTSSSSSSLLRFLNSENLNPSPTQEDARPSVPFIDPRTGVRVVDSRWVRHAASSKADILVLNRGPLPAPAWSYNKNTSSARNLTWLATLRALEQEHAEPLSDIFADVLSRLDRNDDHDARLRRSAEESDTTKLVIDAALHSTVSTFLPSLLTTLSKLREHAGHRPILETKKPVLWYGSWFLPVSCAPDYLSVFSSESDSKRLLVRLLAQAEAMDNPWSAYYNAQVYMHDRLLARLLPAYNVYYMSSLSTVVPPDVGQTYQQAKGWSCIQGVFETPRGVLMGQEFLRNFIDALGS